MKGENKILNMILNLQKFATDKELYQQYLDTIAAIINDRTGETTKATLETLASRIASIPTAEIRTVSLSLSSGDQTVNASTNRLMSKVTITKPTTLTAANIKSGVSIAGVTGTYDNQKPEQTKTITLDLSSGNQTVSADSGKVMTSVTITKPTTLTASNIRSGTDIAGVIGTFAPTYTGSTSATSNGTLSTSGKYLDSNITIDVPPYVQDISTESAMDALLVAANVGKWYRFTGTTTSKYTKDDIYQVVNE